MRRTLLARLITAGTLAATAAGSTGCSTMNNTEKGALAGGAGGAVLGTVLGKVTGNPKTGAVLGGVGGAVLGGMIGNDMDRKDARDATARHDQAVQQYAAAQPERLAEVVELVKKGQSEQVVLNHIRANRMHFTLSVADLDYLKSNGVPDRIIAEMQTGGALPVAVRPVTVAPPAPTQTVVVREEVLVPAYGYGPYYRPRPVYLAPPPPRPVVGATFIVR
jgi:outer membrane lipoprotein SlyB